MPGPGDRAENRAADPPVWVPLDRLPFSGPDSWPARWALVESQAERDQPVQEQRGRPPRLARRREQLRVWTARARRVVGRRDLRLGCRCFWAVMPPVSPDRRRASFSQKRTSRAGWPRRQSPGQSSPAETPLWPFSCAACRSLGAWLPRRSRPSPRCRRAAFLSRTWPRAAEIFRRPRGRNSSAARSSHPHPNGEIFRRENRRGPDSAPW